MGTNYHHHTNICSCCGRSDDKHIGKNLTMFEGYKAEPWSDGEPRTISSWEDWKAILREGGEVRTEYGEVIDTEEFIRDVEATGLESRERQFRWVLQHSPTLVRDGVDWLDQDGFSFHHGEFF